MAKLVNCARRQMMPLKVCFDLVWFSLWYFSRNLTDGAGFQYFSTLPEYRGASPWTISHKFVRSSTSHASYIQLWVGVWGYASFGKGRRIILCCFAYHKSIGSASDAIYRTYRAIDGEFVIIADESNVFFIVTFPCHFSSLGSYMLAYSFSSVVL